jgi:hypothetical protein
VIKLAMFALIGLLGTAQLAVAENRSVSRSIWVVAQDRVTLRLLLPIAEARQLTPKNLPPPSTEQVASYILGRVSVSAAGSACPAIDQGYDIGRIDTLSIGAGLYGFEIIFHCPSSRDLLLRNAVLFERAPQHVDFARIEQNGAVAAQLFTQEKQELLISAGAAPAGVGEYIRLGISHIGHSLERICFFGGLLVLVRGRRDFIGIAAGLLLGYGACAAICAGGRAIPNSAAVESSVGFLVAFIAAQAIAWETHRPRMVGATVGGAMLLIGVATLLIRGGQIAWLPFGLGLFAASLVCLAEYRWLPIVALPASFGFLDGLVLPGDYARLQLWQETSFLRLMAFNAGAMLAAALFVGLFFGTLLLLRKGRFALPRAAVQDLTAAILACLGAFWMLSAVLVN